MAEEVGSEVEGVAAEALGEEDVVVVVLGVDVEEGVADMEEEAVALEEGGAAEGDQIDSGEKEEIECQ